MAKYNQSSDMAKYIAYGMVIGSAVGTCAAVLMTSKKKKPCGIREKAMSTVDTMGAIMQNIANMVR